MRHPFPPAPGFTRATRVRLKVFMSWQTAMWLSCEVYDEAALGNLHSADIRQIWHCDRYREFRRRYIAGMNSGCRECVWKTAYEPLPWKSRIRASEGFSPQLTRGWWAEPNATMIWSKKKSVAEFRVSSQPRHVRISGMLPHDPVSNSNELEILFGDTIIGMIANTTSQFLPFDRTFPISAVVRSGVVLEFHTKRVFRPSSHSDSPDCRDLGFALQHLELR